MFNRPASYLRVLIGRYRRITPVRWLGEFGQFVAEGYENEGSNFFYNGEGHLVRSLAGTDMRVAIDVGANIGDWTKETLAAWPNVHVHAFEMAEPTFRKFSRNIAAAGGCPRVTANCFGVSDIPGDRTICFYPDSPEVTCEISRFPDRRMEKIPARFITGDAYVAEHNIQRIDFLKIDVEGNEFSVIEAFADSLRAGKIQCLQFEYGPFSIDTRILLRDFYKRLGETFWIGKLYPTYVDFRDYNIRHEDMRFANYCCILKTRKDLRERLER